jgi:hypothetical protein
VVSGLIGGYQCTRKAGLDVRNLASFVVQYCSKAIRHNETKKIAVEFCTEVAVLLAVFPWLESVLASRSVPSAAQQVAAQDWFVAKTLGLAALFLLFASIMAIGRGE